jgi:hypothetical protein
MVTVNSESTAVTDRSSRPRSGAGAVTGTASRPRQRTQPEPAQLRVGRVVDHAQGRSHAEHSSTSINRLPDSASQGYSDLRKITRNLRLTFAALSDTGQPRCPGRLKTSDDQGCDLRSER